MRHLRTLASVILALIAIPLFTLAACNFAIEAAVFNRATYDAVLDDDVIFEELLGGILPLVLNIPDAELNFDNQQTVNVQDIAIALGDKADVWEEVSNMLLPADWVQVTITQLVDVFFSITGGDVDQIEQEIDLSVNRARLMGEEATIAAQLIIEQAPICSPAQRETLQRIIDEQDEQLPICNPQDPILRQAATTIIQDWFASLADELEGDRVTVAEFLDTNRDEARVGAISVDLIFNQAFLLFYLCPLAFLSLIVIISVRSLEGFGRWIGSVSVTVGILILLIIFALQIFAFGSIANLFETSNTPVEAFIARFVSALVRSAISASSTSLLTQSGLFIGFGFIFFALAWYFGRNHDDEGSVVLIMEDGQVISTATQRRVASLDKTEPIDE